MLKLLLLSVALTVQTPAPQYQWYTVTNVPGMQAYGHLNHNGYVVDIVQWRKLGEPAAKASGAGDGIPNFGVSFTQAEGNGVRSNDPAFAASIEQAIAAAGQAAQEAGEAVNRPCPGPKPCPPRPRPSLEVEAEKRFELLRDASEAAVLGGLIVVCLGLVAYSLRAKGPDAPE